MERTGNSHTKSLRTVNAQCPICSWKSDQPYLLESSYKTVGKEIDLKPIVKWIENQTVKCYPTLYYMWECPHCAFCANHQLFREPASGSSTTIEKFRKDTLNLYQNNNFRKVLQILAEIPSDFGINFFQAIKRHYIAIYHLEQFDLFRLYETSILGRYYLHLNWLFQDLENWPLNNQTLTHLTGLHKDLHDVWPKPPMNSIDAARRALKYYETAYDNMRPDDPDGTEHQLLQLMGRLNIKLHYFDLGLELLSQSASIASKACFAARHEYDRTKRENLRRQLLHRIHILEQFCRDTENLIKELSKKEEEGEMPDKTQEIFLDDIKNPPHSIF